MGHTQNTHHKGGIGPNKCTKRNGLTRWQDSRGTPNVKQAIHKDSHSKIRIGKGKRTMEQPLKSSQCPLSCTLPRVAKRPSTPASPLPGVPIDIVEADCRVTIMPTQTIIGGTPQQGTRGQPTARPNYNLQNKDNN